MKKEYFLRFSLGSSNYRWIRVDSSLFNEFYCNDLYCMKRYSRVYHGFKHEYYTFYLQRSNGLAKLNSTVRFMILGDNYE